MSRVEINPELLQWARNRANLSIDALKSRFPKLTAWESGEEMPTLKQLENFAKATYAPIGYFFLPEPLKEQLPIPDFRTIGNTRIEHPTPNLLDTIYLCQQRQEWYRDFMRGTGEQPLAFVGSISIE